MNARIAAHKERAYTALMVEAMVIINDLAENGPAYTGASAGRADRGSHPLKPSHPAWGMVIGNAPGNSGWQMQADDFRPGIPVLKVGIANPMWDPYLKFVNYGLDAANEGGGPAQHFLEKAWSNHKARGAFSWH